MLDAEKTVFYLRKAKKGDKKAAEILLENNSLLIKSIIRRFKNKGVEYDDLYQLGCVGFLKAIKNFDLSYDVCFSTYAVPLIMGEIKRFLRDDGIIKVSRSLKEIAQKAKITKEILEKELNRDVKLSEIAERIGESPSDLAVALEANIAPESLYKEFNDGDKSGGYLIDKIANNADTEEEILDKISLGEAIKALDERERKIIMLRYFRGKTQSEIASVIGISQVQVSRLEKKILSRMKEKMTG